MEYVLPSCWTEISIHRSVSNYMQYANVINSFNKEFAMKVLGALSDSSASLVWQIILHLNNRVFVPICLLIVENNGRLPS